LATQARTLAGVFPPGYGIKCSLVAEVLQRTGQVWLRSSGCCMLPVIWPGDVLLIHRVEFQDLKCGDLVLHSTSGNTLGLHRVIETQADTIKIRGDFFASGGDCISPDEALGRLVLIQRGSVRLVPKGELNWTQKVFRLAFRRCALLRALALKLNAVRLRLAR
jgi:hypothetical protein